MPGVDDWAPASRDLLAGRLWIEAHFGPDWAMPSRAAGVRSARGTGPVVLWSLIAFAALPLGLGAIAQLSAHCDE